MNEKLKNVQWGEYRIGDLFKVKTVKGIDEGSINLKKQYKKGLIEFVGRTPDNNGVKGYVELIENTEPQPKNIISVIQIGTIVAQLREKDWYGSQNIFSLIPLSNSLISLGVLSSINKSLCSNFTGGYSNYPTLQKLEELKIKLPTKNGQIDFEFMERFVAELEAQRVAELEAQRVAELEAYLQATGLVNYALNKEEEKSLKDLEKVEWKEYKIGELFNINSYKKRFDANKVTIGEKGYPYVVRTALNNGVKGDINESEEYLNPAKTISFGQDTATIFYQKTPYFTGDKIKILKLKESELKEKKAMYYITAMNKSFKEFSWGRSSFSVDIISNQNIKIPTKNDKPDYEYMESLISAVQKLVIKDVVIYADKKIEATKKVIDN